MFRNGTRFDSEHQQLTVIDTPIKTDAEGRYCLNDLHKAAGGEGHHRPSMWAVNQQTKELIDELSRDSGLASMRSIRGGKAPGTYVVKELVYAYAMWISPAFHLKVIQAYDTLQTQGIAVADHAAEDKGHFWR